MLRRALVPTAVLWLLALFEREEGAAYVAGLGAAFTLLVLLLDAVYERLRGRRAAEVVLLVELLAVLPGGVAMAVAEHALWPARDLTSFGMVLAECLPAAHAAALVWAMTSVLPRVAEESRRRRAEAEHLRVAAELASLRAQLTPHFIRNTLNAVAGLLESDPDEARELLAQLGDLLDRSADGAGRGGPSGGAMVGAMVGAIGGELEPIAAHLAWLRTYARILELRYADLIAFEWSIDERLGEVLVPRLLLQPLVENAVEHGALRAGRPARVRIAVEAGGGGAVVCRVEDDGPGFAPGARPAVGLAAARRRFELFAPGGTFDIASSPAGTRIELAFPRGGAA